MDKFTVATHIPTVTRDIGLVANDPLENINNANKFDAWVNNAKDGDTLIIPCGSFHMNKLQPIRKPVSIIGANRARSILVRNYAAIGTNDAFMTIQQPCEVGNFSILSASGTNRGTAITILDDAGWNADGTTLRDLYITSEQGSNWDITLLCSSDQELGLRSLVLDNIELFAGKEHSCQMINVQGCFARLNGFSAGGGTGRVIIQHTGNYKSSSIHLITFHINQVWLYHASNIRISGNASVIPDGNSSYTFN